MRFPTQEEILANAQGNITANANIPRMDLTMNPTPAPAQIAGELGVAGKAFWSKFNEVREKRAAEEAANKAALAKEFQDRRQTALGKGFDIVVDPKTGQENFVKVESAPIWTELKNAHDEKMKSLEAEIIRAKAMLTPEQRETLAKIRGEYQLGAAKISAGGGNRPKLFTTTSNEKKFLDGTMLSTLYGLELKDAFAGSGAKTTRTIDPTTGADIITTEPYSLREYFDAYEVPGSEMAIKALDVTRSELANIKPGDKQSVVNAIQKFSDIIESLPINTRTVRDQDGKLISVDFNHDAGLIYQAAKIALQKQLNGISAIEDRRKAHDEFYGQSDQNGGSQSGVFYDPTTGIIEGLFDKDEQTDGWAYRVEGESVVATSPDGRSFQTDMPVEEARSQGLIR